MAKIFDASLGLWVLDYFREPQGFGIINNPSTRNSWDIGGIGQFMKLSRIGVWSDRGSL